MVNEEFRNGLRRCGFGTGLGLLDGVSWALPQAGMPAILGRTRIIGGGG